MEEAAGGSRCYSGQRFKKCGPLSRPPATLSPLGKGAPPPLSSPCTGDARPSWETTGPPSKASAVGEAIGPPPYLRTAEADDPNKVGRTWYNPVIRK